GRDRAHHGVQRRLGENPPVARPGDAAAEAGSLAMNTHSPDSNATPNASPNANPNANTHPGAQHAQARDDRFDAAMRGLHRAALANVSPQARWKFRPALAARPGAEGL